MADALRCSVFDVIGPHNRPMIVERIRGAVVALNRGQIKKAKYAEG